MQLAQILQSRDLHDVCVQLELLIFKKLLLCAIKTFIMTASTKAGNGVLNTFIKSGEINLLMPHMQIYVYIYIHTRMNIYTRIQCWLLACGKINT